MLFKFSVDQLMPMVNHARASQHFDMGYKSDASGEPALLLVKDEGVYLMSNGMPRLSSDEDADLSKVVYAIGFSPKDGWFGGDDYVEVIPLSSLDGLLGMDFIEIITDDKWMSVSGYSTDKHTTGGAGQ